jgi:UDP-GlcNAc:undecaprenyl-phosphate/decaprenyl-phosphate GlcNAc-1-phosphate transferase
VRNYLLTLLVAAAVTYLLTPVARWAAIRFGAMAGVRDRDVHDIPVPRWGGTAMFGGVCAAFYLAAHLPFLGQAFAGTHDLRAILSGCAVICALGVIDDRWPLDALTKFAGQVLAAGVMVLQGVQLLWLPISGLVVLTREQGAVLTVLVIVVTINAVNFVDGLDGLLAGIVAIAAGAFLTFAYLLTVEKGFDRATVPALVSTVLVGVCLGFLHHNVHPARLFMGDSGSMLLGLLLATMTITLTGQLDPNSLRGQVLAPALIPLLLPAAVLAIPLVDLLLAVVRRTRAGRSPFAPDKQHLHHRLLEIGHSQRRAVTIMYLWTAIIAFGAVATAFLSLGELLIYGGVVLLAAVVVTVRLPRLRTRHS